MVFGRLSFEKGQAPPSRFVRQFLGDLDAFRRFVCGAEESDRVVEDARAAAGLLGIDLPRETPLRDQKWWEWLLPVPATNIRKLLSCATKADLWPGLPSEILTCEKCGVRIRGETGLKIHLPQCCGQSAHVAQAASRLEAKTQRFERAKKWPCSYCQKEFSTWSSRIADERTSCRNKPPQPHVSAQAPTKSASIVSDHTVSFSYRHHIEPRVQLYVPKEETFPIPLKYIDVTRTTHTNLDVKQEKRIDDYWNIDGSRDLSDPWTGFTQFTLLDEKAPDGYTWSGGRLTRKQLTSRPDHLWPELWKSMGKNAKLKEKQKWSEEKIHLENARKLRGNLFHRPRGQGIQGNHQERAKEVGNIGRSCYALQNYEELWEWRIWQKQDQNLRVFWKLMNPPECVWETRYHQITKTILQEKVRIHYSITIWFTNLFLCLRLWKFRQWKQWWTRNGKNWRKFRRGTWRKSEVRKERSMKQGCRALQFILHH